MAETDIELDMGDGIKVNGRIDLVKRREISGEEKTYIVDFKRNIHIFPMPTAEPMQARINPHLLLNDSLLSFIFQFYPPDFTF